jgi:adenylyltransferase/sulfurtransferase
VAEILVRCGIGKLILIDNKAVDPPDLSRQTLYSLDDVGKPKALAAAARLSRLTGRTELVPCCGTIGSLDFPLETLGGEGWLDCLDNFPSRFALEALLPRGAFMVHGAIRGNYGQAITILPGITVSLRALYGTLRQPEGIIPVAAPIVYGLAVIIAQEAMYNLWGTPQLVGKLMVVDMNHFVFERQALAPEC